MGSAVHLTKRFFGSLWPIGPNEADTQWVRERLLPAEYELWASSSAADRRHSFGVATDVQELLGGEAPREVLAAALLHDIGKTVSGLGTYFRVAATLSAAVAGRETAELWVKGSGVTRRIGLYLKHPDLGADLLEIAGSDPLTVSWAREHHLPKDNWTIDRTYAEALDTADND